MSGKHSKTTPNKTSTTTEYDVKLKGRSDGYNLQLLYPRSPFLAGYSDDEVIQIARKLLNSKETNITDNPDFPAGIVLDYVHETTPDQLTVKQVNTGNEPVVGEGYAPLPHILNDTPIDDIEPSVPDATNIDSIDSKHNVKKSSLLSKQQVGDVLVMGTSEKANVNE